MPAPTWTLAQPPLKSYTALYGQVLYGIVLYSGQFGIEWTVGTFPK